MEGKRERGMEEEETGAVCDSVAGDCLIHHLLSVAQQSNDNDPHYQPLAASTMLEVNGSPAPAGHYLSDVATTA